MCHWLASANDRRNLPPEHARKRVQWQTGRDFTARADANVGGGLNWQPDGGWNVGFRLSTGKPVAHGVTPYPTLAEPLNVTRWNQAIRKQLGMLCSGG